MAVRLVVTSNLHKDTGRIRRKLRREWSAGGAERR